MKRILSAILPLLLCGTALANTCPILTAGATSQSVNVTFIDNTTGLPVAGLAFNSSGIDINYTRAGAAQTAVTEATQTAAGAFSSGGFVSNGQGTYRFDIPNAAIATGVPYVTVTGVMTGYTMLPCTVMLSPKVDVDTIKTNPVVNGGTLTFPSGATLASTTNITAGTIATVTNLTNAPTAGDFTATMKTSIGTAVAASAVASVTGAVGSVATGGITNASFACTGGSFLILGVTDCGTAQSASSTGLVLRSAAAFGDDTAIGQTLLAQGSTQGYPQARGVTDNVNSTDATTVETWGVTPSGTITYYLFGTAPSSGSGSGLDAAGVRAAIGMSSANLDTQLSTIDDFVDTEVAAIKTKTDFLPSATAGATGGVFIAGTNAATTITTGLTTTFTGNLSGSVGSVATGGITAASIATDAIGAAELASDAVTEIQTGLATPTNITAGTITTVTNLTNAPGAGDLTATMKTSVQTAAAAANAAYDAPTKAELDAGFAALLTSQQIIVGTCSSGSTTTCVDAALTQAAASQLESRLICFSDSWCGLITTFTPASDTVTTTKIAPSTRASKTYTIFPSTLD